MYGIQKPDELIVPLKLRTAEGRRRKLKAVGQSMWREGAQVWPFAMQDTTGGTQ